MQPCAEFGLTDDDFINLREKAKQSFGDFVPEALTRIIGDDILMFCSTSWKIDGPIHPSIPANIKIAILGMIYYTEI